MRSKASKASKASKEEICEIKYLKINEYFYKPFHIDYRKLASKIKPGIAIYLKIDRKSAYYAKKRLSKLINEDVLNISVIDERTKQKEKGYLFIRKSDEDKIYNICYK